MKEKLFIGLFAVIIIVAGVLYFMPKKGIAPTSGTLTGINNSSATDGMNQPNTASPTSTNNNVNALTTDKAQDVDTVDITYFETTKGYLAKPKTPGIYPGVVMIHEWWGLNDNIKSMARELAGQGYAVLAVDLYNGSVAQTQDEAMKLVQGLDQAKAVDNIRAAVDFLRVKEKAPRLATLGWCFGGGQSMQYAVSGDQIDATVIYYGTLVTDPQKLAAISWPVLGIFGDKDQAIPVQSAHDFDSALDTLHIQNEIYIYPGLGHAFANPSGANYAPNETKDAWQKTLTFLAKSLK